MKRISFYRGIESSIAGIRQQGALTCDEIAHSFSRTFEMYITQSAYLHWYLYMLFV